MKLILLIAFLFCGCASRKELPRPNLGVAKQGVTDIRKDVTDAKGALSRLNTAADRADYKLSRALEYLK